MNRSIIATVLIIIATSLTYGYYKYGIFTEINYFTAQSDITEGKIEILTYGLALFSDSVENQVVKKYGFRVKSIADCNVNQRLINQVDSYNSAVMDHLNTVNDPDWYEKLSNELDSLETIYIDSIYEN